MATEVPSEAAEAGVPAEKGSAGAASSPLARIGGRFALLGAWLLVIVIFAIATPETFLSAANIQTILSSQAVLVVLTLGLIVPMTAGDYDLSVSGVLSLSAMMLAVLNVEQHVPIALAIVAVLVMGVITGLVNSFFVIYIGIESLIVTLGTTTVLTGIVLWISNSNTISGISPTLVDVVFVKQIFGVAPEFYYGLLLCAVLWYAFEFTTVGRRLLFVGRGRRVARLSGLRVNRIRMGALVSSGVISALAGILYAGTTGAANPGSGAGFLLPAFAAAFLGATTILPGRFNPWGTVIAVYFLVTGITGLQLLGVQSYVQQLFYGGALVFAVSLAQVARGRKVDDPT
ncbi:MAG: ABC transporter permease [Candidatus Nephthysia bennettiae]|uniref:ABC transporter permease n=1 Tax=Candidatus Nephthysia bennettiae TaxID=3127016 RepID=A0A934KDR2_9BACT|nr:ABC transporter permease [Candidatus Dormibacteraeota bacterium]PZR86052.1 MAG: ABC transporter permease [Candidatus Dormibacteraeota bacterium]